MAEDGQPENINRGKPPRKRYQRSLLFSPKSAVEELEIKEEDIRYLYDCLDFLSAYNGERKVYSAPHLNLFNNIDKQYGLVYCDYENGQFDYNTDTYKKYYSTLLSGWSDINNEEPWYSTKGLKTCRCTRAVQTTKHM